MPIIIIVGMKVAPYKEALRRLRDVLLAKKPRTPIFKGLSWNEKEKKNLSGDELEKQS